MTLADLATGGHARALASDTLPPAKGRKPATGDARGTIEAALRKAEGALADLLGDKEAPVRAAAALVLALCSSKPGDLLSALATRVKKEADVPARASQLLAIGVLQKRLDITKETPLLVHYTGDEEERWPTPPPALVATAATLALVVCDPDVVNDRMIAAARSAGRSLGDVAGFPWNHGDAAGLVGLLLPRVEVVDVPARLATLDAAMRAKPRKAGQGRGEPIESRWQALFGRVMKPFAGRKDAVLPEELTDGQRALLAFVAEHDGLAFPGASYGFFLRDAFAGPSTIRRYVAGTHPGALERVRLTVGGRGPWPIWKWFAEVSAGRATAAEVTDVLRRELDAQRVVELARDATSGAYWSDGEGQFRPSPRAEILLPLLESSGEAPPEVAAIRAVLEPLRDKKWPGDAWKGGPLEKRAASAPAGPSFRRFTEKGKPAKFVQIELGGNEVWTSRPGKGTKKQAFATAEEAREGFEKACREQTKAGMELAAEG